MRRCNIIEALKQFIATKPPLVVFIFCLVSFLIILVSLMIHLNTHELKNPDIADWNGFKEHLSSLQYCFKLLNYQELQNNLNQLLIEDNLNQEKKLVAFSFQTNLLIQIEDDSLSLSNISSLYGRIDGYQIGLIKEEVLRVSFHLIDPQDIRLKYELKKNSELCLNRNNPLNKNNLNNCNEISVKVCANLIGSRALFPESKPPPTCNIRSDTKKFQKYFLSLKETPEMPSQFQCPTTQGIRAKILHMNDPNLSVMLNQDDKDLINFHLRNCLYALSLFTAIMLTYQIIKNRSRKQNLVYQPVNTL